MKHIDWNPEKNIELIEERNISFEDVVFYLQQDALLDDIEHPNQRKYPSQRVFVINVEGYAYLIPYIESKDEIFLKTVIPSRKATKLYLGET